jgi:hypothetical protein
MRMTASIPIPNGCSKVELLEALDNLPLEAKISVHVTPGDRWGMDSYRLEASWETGK